MFKRKKQDEKRKALIADYRLLHIDMLLYKSAEHYRVWTLFGENIPSDLRQEFMENPKVNFPESIYAKAVNLPRKIYFMQKEFLIPPIVVDSFDFTEADLNLAREEYTLFDSEKESNQCPFCRSTPHLPFMRILSGGKSLESGGVCMPCIHLLWDEDYEVLPEHEFIREMRSRNPEIVL